MVSSRALSGQPPARALAQVRAALEEAGCPDAAFDAACLYRLATGRDARLNEEPLNEAQADELARLTGLRCARRPLQYLAGSWGFLDLELKVGPGVLIPRPDTETLCLAAAAYLRGKLSPRVLELCSGSGCLALGLCRLLPGVQVLAVEKSGEAWPYLTANIEAAGGEAAGVRAQRGDVFGFEKTLAPDSFELILSNPPYLTRREMENLQPEVRCEPVMALLGGEDGLDFYRHIITAYKTKLVPGGVMAFEVGWQQAEAVSDLFARAGYGELRAEKDVEGRLRAVLARRPATG